MTRKSGRGSAGLLGVALVVAVALGGHYLAIYLDKRRFPWGYANSGSPPLVGTWVGQFTTWSGKQLAMLIDIELVELGRGRRYTLRRNGGAITSSNDPDTGLRTTPLTLRRGTESTFDSLCGEL